MGKRIMNLRRSRKNFMYDKPWTSYSRSTDLTHSFLLMRCFWPIQKWALTTSRSQSARIDIYRDIPSANTEHLLLASNIRNVNGQLWVFQSAETNFVSSQLEWKWKWKLPRCSHESTWNKPGKNKQFTWPLLHFKYVGLLLNYWFFGSGTQLLHKPKQFSVGCESPKNTEGLNNQRAFNSQARELVEIDQWCIKTVKFEEVFHFMLLLLYWHSPSHGWFTDMIEQIANATLPQRMPRCITGIWSTTLGVHSPLQNRRDPDRYVSAQNEWQTVSCWSLMQTITDR